MRSSRSISKFCALLLLASCARSVSTEEKMYGTIAYPFGPAKALAINRKEEKFIIRSVNGSTEYAVEIPGAAEEYDIEVPMADLGSSAIGGINPKDIKNPAVTDRQAVASFPSIANQQPTDSAFVDKAFGVGEEDGPTQSPSYTLGLAKINQLYTTKRHELALIEIDNLLGFYPNSPKLYKMKGTVLVKLQEWNQAEQAWLKALALTPQDNVLRKSLTHLQKRIKRMTSDATTLPPSIPEPIKANPQNN